MKVLLVHGYSEKYGYQSSRLRNWLERLRTAGIDVTGYAVPLDVRGMRMPWHELDYRWKTRSVPLLTFYEELGSLSAGYDVLVNFGAVNLHPEYVKQLSPITVLRFNDDPEGSEYYSRPVAPGHDICVIGNIAEVETYRSWGIKHVAWAPMGFWRDECVPATSADALVSQARCVDVALLCERLTQYRRRSVDRYARAFPNGAYYGTGWPKGFLPEKDRVPLLQKTRIGINIHNSTGPVNSRTYYLPANGVMQICDNKSTLSAVYEIGREVVGFSEINEAIELTHYYLNHEPERRAIAAAGFQRAMRDYNEVASFKRILFAVEEFKASERFAPRPVLPIELSNVDYTRPSRRLACQALAMGRTFQFRLRNALRHRLPRMIGRWRSLCRHV